MAVKVQELTVRYYTGYSTDEKPINNDVHAGDKFLETDTGNEHTYTGGFWALTQENTGSLLRELNGKLDEQSNVLKQIRLGLTIQTGIDLAKEEA